MYTNSAYLGLEHEDIVNLNKPIVVTAAGHFKVLTNEIFKTERPNGRGDYQLIYIAAGKAHFRFNGTERIIQNGNMVLFRPNETQMYYLYADENPETYWVHFTGSDVDQLLDRYQMPKNENVFFTGTSPDYQWLFRQLIEELQLKRINFEDLLSINLRQIFLFINRYIVEKNNFGKAILDEIKQATKYFNENYNKTIVIENYAKEHAMTANWFTQSFKKVTNFTPMQYIISLRIANAMNLIDNTDYNMTQIAEAVGYDNSMYFSRIFRKHTGLSPTEYKNISNPQEE